MTKRKLFFRYTFFAVLATVANLAAQRGILWFDGSPAFFMMAVVTGTAVGLVLKFNLDKRWIFRDLSTGTKVNGNKFALYAATGVVTTVIFWSSETFFWLIWQTAHMREIGAVIGLGVGYVMKYQLDKKLVFTELSRR